MFWEQHCEPGLSRVNLPIEARPPSLSSALRRVCCAMHELAYARICVHSRERKHGPSTDRQKYMFRYVSETLSEVRRRACTDGGGETATPRPMDGSPVAAKGNYRASETTVGDIWN